MKTLLILLLLWIPNSFAANLPPRITLHPTDAEVPLYGTVEFVVEVTGTEPINFQWRFNGARIIGAISRQLTLQNISTGDVGEYSVDVSNSFGIASSTSARLKIFVDSDGDGLSDNFENGLTRFQFIAGPITWENARMDAVRRGGHLATITSSAEWESFKQSLGARYATTNFWLGGTDQDQEGVWRWITGEPWVFTKWIAGEPNNGAGGLMESFVHSRGTEGGWNDLTSEFAVPYGMGYALEIGFPTDPLKADTDGDGLNDYEETFTTKTLPHYADSDFDGLSDKEETVAKTSPLNPDSDSDGVLDALEVKQFLTDPLSADTDNDGLLDGYEIGITRYSVVRGSFSWHEAKADAEQRRGHLVTVTSESEWAQIKAVLGNTALEDGLWLGASDLEIEGEWKWVTGEPFEFRLWNFNEPNGARGENYLVNWNGFRWADSADSRKSYVLEIGYPSNPLKMDTDDDGFNDGTERLAGKSPSDPHSFPSAALEAYTALEIEFFPQANKKYQIQISEDLIHWSNLETPITGDGNPFSKLYSVRGSPKMFHRVELVP